MTRSQLVEWLVSNAAVVRAGTTTSPTGQPVPPSATALQAMAAKAIDLTVGDLLTYESILRAIGTRTKNYTVTDATIPIPDADNVGEIISVTIGTAKKPLRHFANPADYNDWHYENVGDNEDESDDPVGYHLFTTVAGVRQLTVVPGVGGNTTLDVWYLKDYTTPFDISLFPAPVASILAAGCVRTIVDGQFGEDYQTAIARLAKRSRSGIAEAIPLRHSKEYEDHWKTRNQSLKKLF